MPPGPGDADWERRREAAEKYRPERVRLLLVAHAPPVQVERYFYFEQVREKDDLFRYVVHGLFGTMPDREHKANWLRRLRDAGVFLIDLVEQPVTTAFGRSAKVSDLGPFVPGLVKRAQVVNPDHVVLIKVDVYDAAFRRLRNAGLPVVDERIAFPTSGRQHDFEVGFGSALSAIAWAQAN